MWGGEGEGVGGGIKEEEAEGGKKGRGVIFSRVTTKCNRNSFSICSSFLGNLSHKYCLETPQYTPTTTLVT